MNALAVDEHGPGYRAHHVLDALERAGLTEKPDNWAERLDAIRPEQVMKEVQAPPHFSISRLITLLSPAGAACIEPMALAAHRLTRQRFGNAISLFAPLYVSNFCVNQCRYCGFNTAKPHRRRRLSIEESLVEADIIAAEGFRDILLVSGEDALHIDVDYMAELSRRLRESGKFSAIGIEVYTQSEGNYRKLYEAGIDGVTIFQETYEKHAYASWHPGGPKSIMANRILASEAAASAGMRRIGLGVLLGLEDWRFDAVAMAVHADTLAKHYWRAKTSFSFPRIRPSESGHDAAFPYIITDADLTRMIAALRLCFPDSGMVLSTRESPALRDHLIPLGVTSISAGSKTNPGGYAEHVGEEAATEQFAISDERTAGEMAAVLTKLGYDPVWKDWDTGFVGTDR